MKILAQNASFVSHLCLSYRESFVSSVSIYLTDQSNFLYCSRVTVVCSLLHFDNL